MFWNTLLRVNSFLIIPAAGMFLIYAGGDTLLHGQWKEFIIAALFFTLSLVAEVILGIMDDA